MQMQYILIVYKKLWDFKVKKIWNIYYKIRHSNTKILNYDTCRLQNKNHSKQ